MRYVGGKSKLARELSEVMISLSDKRTLYVEPFLGGGSVFAKMAPHFSQAVGSDLSEDLILMWAALRQGWVPTESISEDEYSQLRVSEPSPLRGLVGFGGSFGGKWFGGYARGGFTSVGDSRNHYGESRRSVLKIADQLKSTSVEFERRDYRDYRLENAVVYADPPYENTQGYDSVGSFSSAEFWKHMTLLAEAGNTVFVSEYQAPDSWVEVWSKPHRQSLTQPKQGRAIRTEKLFMLRT